MVPLPGMYLLQVTQQNLTYGVLPSFLTDVTRGLQQSTLRWEIIQQALPNCY